MIEGVCKGYIIEQELVGVGYRAKSQGQIGISSRIFSPNYY